MPRIRRHSTKKRYNKKRYTKRRGGGTPPDEEYDYDALESGKKYGEGISAPPLYNPDTLIVPISETIMREETASARETAINEFEKLSEKFESDQKKREEVDKVRKSLLNPTTKEEAAAFFDGEIKKQCVGESCSIMGGRKTCRKRRRKSCRRRGRKTYRRRRRKSYRRRGLK